MSTTTTVLIAIGALGLLLGGFYGVMTAAQLVQARRIPPIDGSEGRRSPDASRDTPRRRFKGEAFESSWQGSEGYARPVDPQSDANQMDRLIVSTFTPLRPSRFGDSSYWKQYLPGALIMYVGLFVGVPLLVGILVQPATGSVATFTPTAAQRAIPGHGTYVTQPSACPTGSPPRPPGGQALSVDYSDDGTVFAVHPHGEVAVTYFYGRPLFSPGAPLCADPSGSSTGIARYSAASSGSGYIYIPQPTGTLVVQITVAQAQVVSSLTNLQLLFVVAVLAVLAVDVVLTILLKRSVRDRYSR
ncbi:MAG: hypothetical protein ABSB09_06150 [Acidimicrobiales bacterium]|jgi:hypothetical protein